jgi:8-oxo-dGTP diphosphatase
MGMIAMEKKIVSGPIIIENGKLLLIKDEDNFYKIPGGKLEIGESLEEACKREVKEEINGDIIILKELSTMTIYKPDITLELHHFLAKLKNRDIKPESEVREMKWIEIKRLNQYDTAPNIKFLIERGEIR